MSWFAVVLLFAAMACLVAGAALLALWAGLIVAGVLFGLAGIGLLDRQPKGPVDRS